jgi:putative transport protein
MAAMADMLVDNPVLLLVLVVGFGGVVGAVRIAGFSLGPAAALFLGLAVSAWDERLVIPDIVLTIGLVLFAYLVGLDAGPSLGLSAGRRSLAAGAAAAAVIVGAAGAVWAAASVLDLSPGGRAGLFAGALTNTPALAAATEQLDAGDPSAAVGYSLAYPLGVVVMLVAAQAILRRKAVPDAADRALVAWTIRVEQDDLPPLGALRHHGDLAFGRARIAGRIALPDDDSRLDVGDLLVVIGHSHDVAAFADEIGSRSDTHLPLDRRTLDFRRIVVSDRAVVGRRLGDLDLLDRFGAAVTRIRRGDADVVATDDAVLRAGDRIRVVASRDRFPQVAAFFGDSERRLAELDSATLGLGIAAGLLVGLVPIPIPGGTFELGAAGGPLIVGLALGAIGRTGPLTWTLPYGMNSVLRQFGALLFFATVGTRSGAAFAEEVGSLLGLETVLAGALVTAAAATAGLAVARALSMDPAGAAGLLAGLQTQPAVLAFADRRTDGDDRVNVGYAMVFPVAMIVKIIAAQVLART